jgi:ribosomal protein L12E/L44/L45/RPP1/RPP2
MQQVMARLIPTGWAIDETVLQNVDYGLGDAGNKEVDHTQAFFQTGLLYYNGIDAEGKRVPPPITELTNAGFSAQMQGLIQNYQFNYQALKDELGEDPNLMSAALQPRVTGQNVEASQQTAEYATDYIYKAYAECMKQTARKISCLLKDSIEYGSKAYRHIAQKEDFTDRQFSTDIRFLPTQFELQRFEIMMNEAIRSNPELLQFLDPFKMLRAAQEDVKLGELLFRQAQKKLIAYQKQTAQQNQQATFQAQIESAKAQEKEKRETKELEIEGDVRKSQVAGLSNNQTAVLNLVTSILKPSETGGVGTVPPDLKPLVDAVIQNIMVSAVASSEEQRQQIIGQMQAAQQQMQQQEEVQPEEQNIEQQPQVAA